MGRYTQIKSTAARLIDRFGMDAVISRRNDSDYPVRVVMVEYQPNQKDGQLIGFTDRKALVAANGLGIVPDAERDRLVADQDMQIVTVTKVSPGGDDIIYELQVRP